MKTLSLIHIGGASIYKERLRNASKGTPMSESMSDSDKAVLSDIKDATGAAYEPEKRKVEFTGEKTATEQYVDLVQYLVENEYITDDDLPISAQQAQTRYLINSKPNHEDGKMIRPRKVEGMHVETNHDTASKQRYARRYIEIYILNR